MKTLHVALIAAALACAGTVLADPGKGKSKKNHEAAPAEQSATGYAPGQGEHGRPAFSEHDRDEISSYFGGHPDARKQLPPGLAKQNKIPPGWQKKLERGQRIPDDVWAHRVPLPRDLKLGETKLGVIHVRIEDRIVKVAEKTREVLDVLNLPVETRRSSPPR
jgi:hypothetical protein